VSDDGTGHVTGGAFRRPAGGRIDRTRPLAFTFDGRPFTGFAGDTLASALIANGVHFVARSFKYHRPRGILSAGAEEPNALVRVGTGGRATPNLRATQVALHDGLAASSQNAWPRLGFDLGALTGPFGKLLVAGFYYKTFMWPAPLWRRLYEPAIRRMAGMGRAPDAPDPDRYERRDAHCDVLVIGGGPAGLAAALAAGRTGARVILVDEQAEFGGGLLGASAAVDGRSGADWADAAVAALAAMPELRLLPRTTAFGYYDHDYVALLERCGDDPHSDTPVRERLWHVRARRVVLATGAHERPLTFADNDRPGVMLTGAARTYAVRYAALPGRRAVVFTDNGSAYAAAADLAASGVEVAALVDLRPDPPGVDAARAAAAGIPVIPGHAVVATHGTRRVHGVEVVALDALAAGRPGAARFLACDLLAMSGGWNPAVHLFSQSGGRLEFDPERQCFRPGVSAQSDWTVGACNGSFALADAIAEGLVAGAQCAADIGFGDGLPPEAPAVDAPEPSPPAPIGLVPSRRPIGHGSAKHFVDFQNDVTAADILLATREGLNSVEHVKRYTTTGMGTDQGKTSNLVALGILSAALGRPIPEIGTTTFRPPYTPVGFGALAGRDVGPVLADPVRVTSIQPLHEAAGAVFEDVGQWKRPRFFPRAGEDMDAAVARECRAVREAVGMLDASTLGKIDIQGPDAVELLNRVYTNGWSNLAVGRCRYGLMCREDGMLFDDGVTARLGDRHFLMTTTTGNAAAVLDWLEEWLQTEWPDLRVWCNSVTEQWANVAIAGPHAREVLRVLAPGLAVEDQTFPHLSVRDAVVAGLPARVFRVGFTGERGYEINVPWPSGPALWQAVVAAGEPFGITPYGTEAMHVLRAEKGFVIVGQETDGTVTPLDLGLGRMLSKSKDFLGRRSLARAGITAPGRKQLVGLLPVDPTCVLAEGAQIVERADLPPPVPMLGHVTSSYRSPTLGRAFALALVADGRDRIGQRLTAWHLGRSDLVEVTEPVFYDPSGGRQRG